MRDILVTLIVFGSIPFIFRRPYIGVLMWAWLGYMNPHRLTWGFAYHMPFSQVIAGVLLLATVFNSQARQRIPMDKLMLVWIIFLVWMGITTALAIYPDYAQSYFIRVVKIQLLTFLTLMLITDLDKLKKLVWVITLSIGFYSIKGGIFTILSGGAFRVWGPPGSFIEDNNGLALSTLMILPLMYYLYSQQQQRLIRYGLLAAMLLSLASAIGSQSRGALLACGAVMGFFWLKSKHKLLTGTLLLLLALIGWNFMPQTWHDRMATLQTYDEDASAMGRINAWIYSINLANDRFIGGGFNSWSDATYQKYSPDADYVVVAHSIYFNVLADHGWLGLILFLTIFFFTWRYLSQVISLTRARTELKDQNTLARMLQVSFVAYFTGGAFLSLSYFDLPWHLVAIAFLLKHHIGEPAAPTPTQRIRSVRYSSKSAA